MEIILCDRFKYGVIRGLQTLEQCLVEALSELLAPWLLRQEYFVRCEKHLGQLEYREQVLISLRGLE